MASVDKVKVADTTYDVSPSKDGTLNGYTSGDSTSPSSWNNVDAITTSDTNSSIFSKLTTMVKNVRWLYNKLGTVDISATGSDTISGGLVEVQNALNNKADNVHTHGVSDLPVSNSQVDSTSYVPSSAVVYSLKSMMDELNDDITNMTIATDDPNTRYESVSIGTWSSVSDVTTFLSKYTHDNGYYDFTTGTKLKLGNYVTISDGTYNAIWEIAGFDCEHNQTAADGSIYDNGYGICLIPKTHASTSKWNNNNTTSGGYISSNIHTTVLPNIVTKLKTVLGTHIVTRNVLLSSSVTSNGSTAYTWTSADATLMSMGQMKGTFASYKNKYDDGEANYKLPLFNYEGFKTGSYFWSRGVSDNYSVWDVESDGSIYDNYSNYTFGVRPLIYLRLDATNMVTPNSRYAPKNLGTWSSIDQVNEFFSKYTHENGYRDAETNTDLGLGDYITIQDGTYNVQWVIAGFDMEHNQTAADGTIYDNGYGICLIPKTQVTTVYWNYNNTTTGGYKSSYMHKTVLPDIVTKLKTILGTHIVNRNVLLSSTVTSGKSSAYTWTTADATLMSIGQMTGTFASNRNQYDDGEANYKLPLFNYEGFKTGSTFWSRGVYNTSCAWRIASGGSINYNGADSADGVRPLIYLR